MNVKPVAPFGVAFCALLLTAIPSDAGPARVTGVYFLKVRSGPDFEAKELAVLGAGDTVEVIEEMGAWALVALADGTRGYASSKYLVAVATSSPADDRGPAPLDVEGPAVFEDQPTPPSGDADAGGAETTAPVAAPAEPSVTARPSSPPPVTAAPPPPLPVMATPPPAEPPAARTPTSGAACTKADLEALRAEIRVLVDAPPGAAGARRASRNGGSVNGEAGPFSLPRRGQLVWLGVGVVTGLLVGRFIGRRERWRQHRIRF